MTASSVRLAEGESCRTRNRNALIFISDLTTQIVPERIIVPGNNSTTPNAPPANKRILNIFMIFLALYRFELKQL